MVGVFAKVDNELHGVEFSDDEKKIIRNIGVENEDYAICAVFEHRNEAEIEYDEDTGLITLQDGDATVEQTVDMITEVCESSDPMQRIGVAISMLEISLNVEQQWRK